MIRKLNKEISPYPVKNSQSTFHIPVMVKEVLNFLKETIAAPQTGVLVDATVGGGGHSRAILEEFQNFKLIGIDWDREAVEFCKSHILNPNFRVVQGNFGEIDKILVNLGIKKGEVFGFLFDLGISLHQVSTPERGFSYRLSGPLDMRFNQEGSPKTALSIIRDSGLVELEKIIHNFGEEQYSRKIAKSIFYSRRKIETTQDLKDLIASSVPKRSLEKALKRVFQALRIATNSELENLRSGILNSLDFLGPNGRIIVISYHSLESKIVKEVFKKFDGKSLRILTKHAVKPNSREILLNPFSHSAQLRVACAMKCE